MARDFNGTTDVLDTSIGSVTSFGYGTIWAVVRLDSTAANQRIVTVTSAGTTNRMSLMINNTGVGRLNVGGTTVLGTTALSTGVWYLLCWTKDTGSVTPRFHFFDYSANTWTHENGDAAAADATTTADAVRFGASATGTQFFNGRIAAAAIKQAIVLADTEVENLAHRLRHWIFLPGASSPTAMWVFDQAATTQTVNDWSGDAHESAITGTSVGSESSPIGYGGIH